MTLTEAQTTKPATDALTDLVNTARVRAARERNTIGGSARRAADLDEIALTLDRARTRLVEDGIEYLDAAWAFVDAGCKQIATTYGATSLLNLVRTETAGKRRRG